MSQPSQIRKLFETIDSAIGDFQKNIPGVQKRMFNDIISLSKDLVIKNGRIANTMENFKILSKIKNKLNAVILNKDYKDAVSKFIEAFGQVSAIQNSYFAILASRDTISTPEFLKEVRKQSIESTVNYLTETGLDANITSKIEDILRQNITTGGKFSDFVEQMREFITTTDTGGSLERYSKTIVTDGLNTFSRTYMTTMAADLGLEWRMYSGSLLTTSRPWCVHMVNKLYVHISELATILHDNIDGVSVCSDEIPCSKKTGLPQGMKAETTVENLEALAGGWECGHKFIAVHELAVPLDIRMKLYAEPTYIAWCKKEGVTPKKAA